MKLELRENMYVRTNDGYINKIKKVNQFNVLVYGRDLFGEELNIPNNEITKASYNIIDILEEGDYVNGCYVLREHYTYMGEHFIELDTNDSWGWGIGYMPTKYIKTIVTHEQMEQMALSRWAKHYGFVDLIEKDEHKYYKLQDDYTKQSFYMWLSKEERKQYEYENYLIEESEKYKQILNKIKKIMKEPRVSGSVLLTLDQIDKLLESKGDDK